MMRSTLRAATVIGITLSFGLPAVDAAAISPNASTGIYSAEQPNLLLVGGKKSKGHKGNRQRGHKSRSRSRSRTVVVHNDYGHDDGNAGAALVTGLIVGAAVGAAINESANE